MAHRLSIAAASVGNAVIANNLRRGSRPSTASTTASTVYSTAGGVVAPVAAPKATASASYGGATPAQRTLAFTYDDLLTLATTRTITATVVKAYLELLVAASAASAATTTLPPSMGSGTAGPASSSGSGFTSAYAFDPLFWPHLCYTTTGGSNGIALSWRNDVAAASRHDVLLVPAPIDVPHGHRRRRSHWLLLMVLRAERVIECYDSLRDDGANEDRCWRALETVRTALVQRELETKYGWTCSPTPAAPPAALAAPSSRAFPAPSSASSVPRPATAATATPTLFASPFAAAPTATAADGEWELRIMQCAQQQHQTRQRAGHGGGGEAGGADSDDAADDSALYMLWFARCILLGAPAPTLTRAPPPSGFRAQIMRELGAALKNGALRSAVSSSSSPS
jgi:hypothetical protein